MSYEAFRLMIQGWASSGYLPEALAYGFVVNALLAGLLIGPVLGGLGTLVVVKRFAFFSEAVGHAALTGVAIGILLGEPYTGPYGSLFGYCLLFGILLNYLRNRTGLAPDTLIGVFLSVSLALGASLLLILAGKINVHILENVLFGSVLTVNGNDLLVLAIVGSLVMALALPLYNRIMLASFNPQLAAVRGVAVKTLDYLFVILVTLITVAAVKVIGAILVGALLVIPAAAARLLSQSLKGFFWCSVLIATVSTLCGILAPIVFDLPIPSGAAIILVAGIAFALAAIARGVVPQPQRESWINGFLSAKTDPGHGAVRSSLHATAGCRQRQTAARAGLAADHLWPGRSAAQRHRYQPGTCGAGEPAGQSPDCVFHRSRRSGAEQTGDRRRCGDRRALAVGG
jgi:zinc transport system permease protein